MQVRVNRRYTLSKGRCFITFAKLTPLMVTADKNVVASLYTTTDDTEIGDGSSTALLGLRFLRTHPAQLQMLLFSQSLM